MKRGVDSYFSENKAYVGLGRASLHSGVLFVVARGVNIVVQLASTILLARALSPDDFGVVAMVVALIGFAPLLIDLGTSEASTQKTHITKAEISALFWLNIAISLGLTVLLMGASKAIAVFFGEPSLTWIALVLSATFVMTAVSTQHSALMRRAMQFRTIAAIDITSNLVGSIVSVVMALTGWGYWSLVAKPIVTAGLNAALVWTTCRWVPGRPRFTPEVKELVGFGLGVTGFTMTDYLAKAADRLAIGYFFGAGPLGYFQNAYTIYGNLLSILTDPLHNIAAAGLSKLRHDVRELKRSWTTAVSSLSYFSAPAFAVLAVTGQDFVVLLLGQKWAPAGPLLCIFAVRGIAQSIERTMGWAHVAAGRSDRWMWWGCFSAAVQLLALAAGLPFGVNGVAMSYTLAMFGLFVPALAYSGRPVGIDSMDVIRAVGPQTAAGLIAVAVGFAVQSEFLATFAQLSRFSISISVCLSVYFAVVIGIFRITDPLQLGFSVLRDLRPVRSPAGSRFQP